jgi:hypothetical protein
MATISNPGGESKPDAATTESTPAARRTSPGPSTGSAAAMAERAVLVPVGASLVARDNLVGTVKGLATKYTTRSGLQREITRYERRGATERNRLESQVRRTRSRFETGFRQRRSNVEKTVTENRRRFEREVRSVRKDLERQSGALSKRVDTLVSDAQGLIGNSAS